MPEVSYALFYPARVLCLDPSSPSLSPGSVSSSSVSQAVNSSRQDLDFLSFPSFYPCSESSPRTEPKAPFGLGSVAGLFQEEKMNLRQKKKIPEKFFYGHFLRVNNIADVRREASEKTHPLRWWDVRTGRDV